MGNGWGARQRRERGLRSEVRERVYSVMRAASIGLTVDTRGMILVINGPQVSMPALLVHPIGPWPRLSHSADSVLLLFQPA